ncbi:hypothetical protein M1O57_01800, partial [Dehalococcoidia bacterium]|nr:hypothetical protein [Dehalococcoidia bacterium]
MSKLKVLVAVLAVVALLLVPTAAFAAAPPVLPPVPPSGFMGTAYLDNVPVAEGTVVTAWIDDTQVGDTTTEADGFYRLLIEGWFPDATVRFKVANILVDQTGVWQSGVTEPLDLFATTPPLEAIKPVDLTLSPSEGLATTVSGVGFTPLSAITVTFDGEPVPTVPAPIYADIEGRFIAMLVAPIITPGEYMIEVTDAVGRSYQAAFTVPDLRGPEG